MHTGTRIFPRLNDWPSERETQTNTDLSLAEGVVVSPCLSLSAADKYATGSLLLPMGMGRATLPGSSSESDSDDDVSCARPLRFLAAAASVATAAPRPQARDRKASCRERVSSPV